jgi:hypothetical protein
MAGGGGVGGQAGAGGGSGGECTVDQNCASGEVCVSGVCIQSGDCTNTANLDVICLEGATLDAGGSPCSPAGPTCVWQSIYWVGVATDCGTACAGVGSCATACFNGTTIGFPPDDVTISPAVDLPCATCQGAQVQCISDWCVFRLANGDNCPGLSTPGCTPTGPCVADPLGAACNACQAGANDGSVDCISAYLTCAGDSIGACTARWENGQCLAPGGACP